MERGPTSITRFLTDGSLLRLCDALGEVGGARITVHDEAGRRIVAVDGVPPWRVEEADGEAEEVARILGSGEGPAEALRTIEPLRAGDRVIGAVVVEPRGSSAASSRLRTVVVHLVRTVNELCGQQVELKRRNAELSALFRLSSLLVAEHTVEAVLNVALRSAVEVLGAEAGAVHLLDEERRLVLRSHLGLDGPLLESARSERPDSPSFRSSAARAGLFVRAEGSLTFNGETLGSLILLARDESPLDGEDCALFRTIVEQAAAAAASARLIESEREARQVQRQLRLAADVQRRMMPRAAPAIPRFDIDARYIPSMDLGGDFYDLIDLSGHLGVLVGDVAGKGIPAAMLMASVRASLRAHADDVYHLDEIMSRVNKAMVRDTLPHEFATIFYGVIDPGSLRLTYCNAGHDPPLILRLPQGRPPEDRDLYELTAGGMVVGVDAAQRYGRGMFDLAPGDTLVAYTDGIVDARDFESKRFGRARLRRAILDTIAANPAASAKAVADHVIWEVRRFVGLNPQVDDETIVVIRVRD